MGTTGVGRRTAVRWTVGWTVCVLVVVFTGVGRSNPAVALSAAGHWVYNHTVGAVFHLDGSSKTVDGEVPMPRLSPADQVLEDGQHGYVVDTDKSRVVVFGKSNLKVDSTLATGSNEQPITLQAANYPYLVYRRTGNIVRLGDPLVVHAHSPLTDAIVTSDGTVWVQRRTDGSICRLPAGASKLSCVSHVAAGHQDRLVALDDHAAVVDSTAGTIAPVQSGTAHTSIPTHGALPTGSKIATTDAGGRLAAVTPATPAKGSSLVLVDTSTLRTGRANAAPITVPLGSDKFDAPLAAGSSVVLVDQSNKTVYTYNNRGQLQAQLSAPAGAGALHASRGQDGRVYIDNHAGTNTLVVDGNGAIASVADAAPAPVQPHGGRLPSQHPTVATPNASTSSSLTGAPTTSSSSTSSTSSTTSPPATGPKLPIDVTPHSDDSIDVEWSSAGAGAQYVVTAHPSGKAVCRTATLTCSPTGFKTGVRTWLTITATTANGQTRTGTSSWVIPWHWASGVQDLRSTPGHTHLNVTWKRPKHLYAGQLIGYKVWLQGGKPQLVHGNQITFANLKGGKEYRVDIQAVTIGPSTSRVTIEGHQDTTFAQTLTFGSW